MKLSDAFGPSSSILLQFSKELTESVRGKSYRFMEEEQFEELLLGNPNAGLRQYWNEILLRAHWAAVSSLLRQAKWLNGIEAHVHIPNHLGFCASLRGFIEASGDALYSLRKVPISLAENNENILLILNNSEDAEFCLFGELEDALLHFQFARKVNRRETAPSTHKAASASNYLNAFESGAPGIKDVYAEMCQVVHPASPSLNWMCRASEDRIIIDPAADQDIIKGICNRHQASLRSACEISLNNSLMILKTLNLFEFEDIRTEEANRFDLSHFSHWQKIENAFKDGN